MKRTALRPVSAKRLALLRQEGGSRRTALKAGPGLERRGRVNPVNRKRKAKRYVVAFGAKAAWIRLLPCATCPAPPPSDPSHVKTVGAGGKSEHLIPQCRRCHDEFHAGCETFAHRHGLDLLALAREFEARWQLRKGSDA